MLYVFRVELHQPNAHKCAINLCYEILHLTNPFKCKNREWWIYFQAHGFASFTHPVYSTSVLKCALNTCRNLLYKTRATEYFIVITYHVGIGFTAQNMFCFVNMFNLSRLFPLFESISHDDFKYWAWNSYWNVDIVDKMVTYSTCHLLTPAPLCYR